MRDARLIELRRHHPDIVGQSARDLLDDLQPGCVDAVVIGAENSHSLESLPCWSARSVFIPLGGLRQTGRIRPTWPLPAGFAGVCRRSAKQLTLRILRSRGGSAYFRFRFGMAKG